LREHPLDHSVAVERRNLIVARVDSSPAWQVAVHQLEEFRVMPVGQLVDKLVYQDNFDESWWHVGEVGSEPDLVVLCGCPVGLRVLDLPRLYVDTKTGFPLRKEAPNACGQLPGLLATPKGLVDLAT